MDMVTLIQLFSVIIIYPWTRTQARTRTWNTCALLVWACWNSLESSKDEKEKKNNLAPDYKRHLLESNMNNQKSSLSPSDHITYYIDTATPTTFTFISSFSRRTNKAYTFATKENFFFFLFYFGFKFEKRAFYVYVFEVRKHSSQTNGQCRLGGFW